MKNIIKNKMNFLSASIAITLASASLQAKTFDPELQSLLAGSGHDELHQVIISFDQQGAPSSEQLNALNALGISGVSMQSLPIVGALATKSQIEAIYAREDVVSVWENEAITFENHEATQLTGVQQLRADKNMRNKGIPYSGRGIGVVVNDSGIDGNHNDIKFPQHVVQNVAGQANLLADTGIVPILYQENIANTEVATGHGSHVAGTIGGNGAMSNGLHTGVAPGADIIGYGSGAYRYILDTMGGFDYALTHQYDYNIRVISNSFGQTNDVGSDFNPDHPTNIVTKRLSDRGIVVVFSAGNSGSGESTITGNFKKAPWVVTVAAGDKNGNLADFSSRGVAGKGGVVEVDGEAFEWEDRPTITAPGVDIVSVRSSTNYSNAISISSDADFMDPAQVPFYTVNSGTSMAAPHVSGIVALMLEANPNMSWREVKDILQNTATNMPGRAPWEAGAGYVNAHAAVKASLTMDSRFGDHNKTSMEFNAGANLSAPLSEDIPISFSPVGETEVKEFYVEDNISMIMATGTIELGTAFVLEDPAGNRYSSGIGLVGVQGTNRAASAPGMQGTWKLYMGGIGSISGTSVDPLRLTNGVAAPESTVVTVKQFAIGSYYGIDDAIGHPAESFIKYAVASHMIDGTENGFKPDNTVTKADLANIMMVYGAVRQSNAGDANTFIDSDEATAAAMNAVVTEGASLKDRAYANDGVMQSDSSDVFGANTIVTRENLAYTVVQTLGQQQAANDVDSEQPLQVFMFDQWVEVADSHLIAPELRGHVQVALNLGVLQPSFSVEQGPYDLEPVLKAHFNPNNQVTRAAMAMTLTQLTPLMAQ
ncbi:S8 family serine peptidase [Aliiglaciecola litoralis]|uniref:SLH domain-containing protein n=1 Tax=Aliiglaciecola litoralis TaxID=582857 RepID=A0ABN1LTU8_9ALTE